MDGTIRIRTAAWFATAIVLAVLCTLLVTQAWSAGAAPGDEDSTFVPTAGCRIADTRPAPNTVGLRSTPLGAGDVFEVTVHGANGDCTGPLAIPADAVAVALNVTAVNATAQSNIRVYPADLAEVPTLSNLNVTAGAPPTPNKVDVKLSPDGKIRVFNFRGSVNIFIDVVGYYTTSSLVELEDRLAVLEKTQPYTITTRVNGVLPPDGEPFVVATISYVAGTIEGGEVTVLSTMSVFNGAADEGPTCSITRTEELDSDYLQLWTSPGANGGVAQVSGHRMFSNLGQANNTFNLVCQDPNESSVFEDIVLTAIVTPN